MADLEEIFTNNKVWAEQRIKDDSKFFNKLLDGQHPEYLWIGCSDSRVPADQMTGLKPGQLFVHRNIANVVVHSDFNCLSVLEYAVEVLNVKHIIVCGHYNCGGVKAATEPHYHGLIDNWLRPIRDLYIRNKAELDAIDDDVERINKLCEFNVIEQVRNVSHTTILQEAWKNGADVAVHGWIFNIQKGLMVDLEVSVNSCKELDLLRKCCNFK